MISFVIPTYRNTQGLIHVISSLKAKCKVEYEIIVTVRKTDALCSVACEIAEEHGCKYMAFDTSDVASQVNQACSVALGHCISVIYDTATMELADDFGEQIEEILKRAPICAIYYDEKYSFPVLSRMVYEVLGYYYMPCFRHPDVADMYMINVMDMIEKCEYLTNCTLGKEIYGKHDRVGDIHGEDLYILKSTTRSRKFVASLFFPFMEDE